MSKILAINAGSSSLKFKLFKEDYQVLFSGSFERIGSDNSQLRYTYGEIKDNLYIPITNHKDAVYDLIHQLEELKIVDNLNEIIGIGHRVVHGGELFKDSILIDDKVIDSIDKLSRLAPLHNPSNLEAIKIFNEVLPLSQSVAIFDTSFHQSMKPKNYIYGTPYEWYEKYSVRKYGFHGISHKYVSERVMEILNNKDAKIIVCHLGNGSSICAVEKGRSIDTSMGFTPLAGLIMGTRSGDIDPSIISYMADVKNCSIEEINEVLNTQSGILGISGVSNDYREIEAGIKNGNERCQLVQDIFVKKIVNYIASYWVELGGVDAIAFTAGIGENAKDLRSKILKSLEPLGINIDNDANELNEGERIITSNDSSVKCYVIPTNEELMICKEVKKIITV